MAVRDCRTHIPRGALVGIKLYPTDLGFGGPRSQRGRSKFAKGELAERIISDLADLSKPYGTAIQFEDGIGVVRLMGSN